MTKSFKLNPQKDPESDFFITHSQLCLLRFNSSVFSGKNGRFGGSHLYPRLAGKRGVLGVRTFTRV
jgi:hypothetical protein